MLLNAVFLYHAWRLYRAYSDAQARRTFIYSIQYLTALLHCCSSTITASITWKRCRRRSIRVSMPAQK